MWGSKKHTDYADDTDWSFHGFFLTRLFHCVVMLTDSDASVIGALKSWARNELAQNPLNHHIINGIDKTHKSIELIKKNPWKRQIRALRDIRVFFDCGTSIAAGDVCFMRCLLSFDFPNPGKVCQLYARFATCIAWIMNCLDGVVERDARPPITYS